MDAQKLLNETGISKKDEADLNISKILKKVKCDFCGELKKQGGTFWDLEGGRILNICGECDLKGFSKNLKGGKNGNR